MMRYPALEFTLSVPFERFVELKHLIERRRRWRWHRINGELAYAELAWAPKAWTSAARFVCVRTVVRERQPGPLQLDLFVPQQIGYEFKVIATNKTVSAATILAFHNGHGAREALFAQLKSHCHLVPCRRLVGNQLFLHAAVLVYNLGCELQMVARRPEQATSPTRAWPSGASMSCRRSAARCSCALAA